jgi:predicted metal-dependent hydrolase
MDERLREFAALFNEEKFFEAHEVLELEWRKTTGPDREFYQGLIQLAAALVHVQKNNPAGAEDLYAKALKRISQYPPYHCGVDCGKILADARRTLDLNTGFPKIK